jgi:hypothetical protein
VFDAFEEGDIAEVDFATFRIRNMRTGACRHAVALPDTLTDLMFAGGLLPGLEAAGYVSPRRTGSRFQ